MEQFKPTEENNRLITEVTERLHSLTGENDDPEKKKIALELVAKIKATEGEEQLKLMKELNDLYDPNKKEGEAVLRGIESALRQAEDSGEAMEKASDTENLESNGIVTVGPLEGEFDPKFFSDDNKVVNLYIEDSFKSKIRRSARNVSEQPSAAISSYTLKKEMIDSEIHAALPKNHVFTQDDLWMIADLIKKQSNGESEELLNDGKVNLFYVQVGASVLVVDVRCLGFGSEWGSEWDVHGWDLDEDGSWNDGDRVFSRNG